MVKKKQTKVQKLKSSLVDIKDRLVKMNIKSNEYINSHPISMRTVSHLGAAMVGGIIGFLIGKRK